MGCELRLMLNKIKIENKNKDKTKILIIKLRFFETEKKNTGCLCNVHNALAALQLMLKKLQAKFPARFRVDIVITLCHCIIAISILV